MQNSLLKRLDTFKHFPVHPLSLFSFQKRERWGDIRLSKLSTNKSLVGGVLTYIHLNMRIQQRRCLGFILRQRQTNVSGGGLTML